MITGQLRHLSKVSKHLDITNTPRELQEKNVTDYTPLCNESAYSDSEGYFLSGLP
jgi:hypothetical protein